MINVVTITAKFVTGTTVQDSDQAKKEVERLFLQVLKDANIIAQSESSGLFSVEILKVESEKVWPMAKHYYYQFWIKSSRGHIWMAKIKTQAYLDKLFNRYGEEGIKKYGE